MAEDTHTTPARASRRTLLAATLGLGALPAAATASPDAELIRLAAALEANHAEAETIPVTLDEGEFDAQMTALTQAGDDMAERLADLRAATLGGLRAKARAVLACAPVDRNGDYVWRVHHDLLGRSLARDLVGDEAADRDSRRVPDHNEQDSEEEACDPGRSETGSGRLGPNFLPPPAATPARG
jgi:hypothetical protein